MKIKAILCFLITFSVCASPLKIVTFNTGLAHGFVARADQRLPEIAKAIGSMDADVVCLQEVWNEEDAAQIMQSAKKNFPYKFSSPSKQKKTGDTPSCGLGDLFGSHGYARCLVSNCIRKSGDAFTDCAIKSCGEDMLYLVKNNRECALALQAQVGKNPLIAVLNVLNPFSAADTFAYHGSNGVLLLSRSPMEGRRVLDFFDISTLTYRVALKAMVNHEQNQYAVYCTHLTANLDHVATYAGTVTSWQDENKAQATRLLSEAQEEAGPVIIAGDFNCSIANPSINVIGDMEKSCRMFLEAGFEEGLAKFHPQCTFCRGNSINSEGVNSTIDHILVKKGHTISSQVIFKNEDSKVLPLSDHFGIASEVVAP